MENSHRRQAKQNKRVFHENNLYSMLQPSWLNPCNTCKTLVFLTFVSFYIPLPCRAVLRWYIPIYARIYQKSIVPPNFFFEILPFVPGPTWGPGPGLSISRPPPNGPPGGTIDRDERKVKQRGPFAPVRFDVGTLTFKFWGQRDQGARVGSFAGFRPRPVPG